MDRNKPFKSNYVKEVTGVESKVEPGQKKRHPQTNGQSKDIGRTLSAMIGSTVQKQSRNWDCMLSELEFDYKVTPNKTREIDPFKVDLGRIFNSELNIKFPRTGTVC